MKFFALRRFVLPLLLALSLLIGGVQATWQYATDGNLGITNGGMVGVENGFSWEKLGIFIIDAKPKSGAIGSLSHNEQKTFTVGDLQLSQGSTSSYTGTSYESNGTKTTVDSSFVSTVRTISGNSYRRKTIATTEISPVTVTLTVQNNTNESYRYFFRGVEENSSVTYSNGLIDYSASVSRYAPSDTGREGFFKDNETMDIDVTFYLSADNTYAVTHSSFSTLLKSAALNVLFGLDSSDAEDKVLSGALDRFQTIVNTPELYEKLVSSIKANYDGGVAGDNRFWTGTYIGNVDGSSDEDSTIVRELFGADTITQEIDGVEQTITLIIKWENIDGDEETGTTFSLTSDSGVTETFRGCEMTLYMTTQDLLEDWSYNQMATPVYATVYTCGTFTDESGNVSYSEWHRLGETYEGKAQVVGYVGGAYSGSFNTGEWYSTVAYHGAGIGSRLDAIIGAYINSLNS